MWDLLKAFGHFYIYSSVHIALCAGLLTFESYLVLQLPVNLDVVLFLTFSTMSIYSLHRLVGMSKVKAFDNEGRYKVIKKYKHHILIYFLVSSLAALYFLVQLPLHKIILLLVPGVLTLAYVLPILSSKKRLRDLPFIKIFLIALVWSWLTLILPSDLQNMYLVGLLALERVLFFIGITIPFDIRDMEVDKTIGVKTLIHELGVKKSKWLAQLLLFLGLGLNVMMLAQKLISLPIFCGLALTYLISMILVHFSGKNKGDWYFGGLLDGTIGLRLILMILFLKWLI